MKTILTSIKITLAFCAILFVGYVLPLWGFAAITSPNHGEAQTMTLNGEIVGAANVGQQFSEMKYFWGRPSAVDYNGGGSGGSNKSVSNPDYLKEVEARIDTFLASHTYLNRKDLPSELVTASGSGLDPHISPQGAEVQIRRVANARKINEERLMGIVENSTHKPLIGQPYINVLELNISLDREANN